MKPLTKDQVEQFGRITCRIISEVIKLRLLMQETEYMDNCIFHSDIFRGSLTLASDMINAYDQMEVDYPQYFQSDE